MKKALLIVDVQNDCSTNAIMEMNDAGVIMTNTEKVLSGK